MADPDTARDIKKVCVYCASSRRVDPAHHDAARCLGALLAQQDITVVYGGGASGSMGALADGALAAGGRVIGVMPRFMTEVEWGHRGLTEFRVVADMHARKRMMLDEADALVALPGGCGTYEELFEALSFKRLGLYPNPIVIVNLAGFYGPLLAQLERSIVEGFMDEKHRTLWAVVEHPEQVLPAIRLAPSWPREAWRFAVT